MFFKKKRVADKVKEDKELVEKNYKSIDALMVIAKSHPEIIEELKKTQDLLKYLIPSSDSRILEKDKVIKNKIGDLRIALTKSDGEMSKKTANILSDIEIAVADRNANLS